MLSAVLFAATLTLPTGGPACCTPAAAAPAVRDEALQSLFEGGVTFQGFLDAARRRTDLWNRLADEGTVDDDLVARARAVGGTWHILAVAEDWCGDSAYNLPYVAKLADAVDGLEVRVINSTVGRALMEAHRTPDGRAATPTFLLLDAGWEEGGCLVERPSPLMNWYMENREELGTAELHAHIIDFYESDKGRGTVTDIVELLEAARAGHPRCGSGAS